MEEHRRLLHVSDYEVRSQDGFWTVLEHIYEFLLALFKDDYQNHDCGWASKNSQGLLFRARRIYTMVSLSCCFIKLPYTHLRTTPTSKAPKIMAERPRHCFGYLGGPHTPQTVLDGNLQFCILMPVAASWNSASRAREDKVFHECGIFS